MVNGGYIDFHTHVIPEVDDGMRAPKIGGLDEALETIQLDIAQGVTEIVCTSHYGVGNMGEVDYDMVERHFEQLKQAVSQRALPVRLHMGAELFGPNNDYILDELAQKRCHTIAGTDFILVEFAEWADAHETAENITERMIGLTKDSRYRPILAHAERYRDFQGKEALYDDMLAAGVRLQINAFDIAENKDPWVRGVSQRLLREEKVFVIGTDTHGRKRPPRIADGAAWIEAKCPAAYAQAVLHGNAAAILGIE